MNFKKIFTQCLFLFAFVLAIPVYAETNLSSSPNLGLEDTNPAVLQLQKFLNEKGYVVNNVAGEPGSIGHETDKFGTKTKQALVNFQKNSGIIPATGYFGPKTKAKIGELSQVTEKDNSNSFAKQNSASAILALNTSSGSGAGTYKLTVKKASLNKSLVGIVYIWPEPVSGPKFNFDTGGDEYLIKKNSTFSAMARVPNKTILFVDFTGDCTKTAPNIDACDIKMTSNKTITAVYKSKPFYQGWSLNLHPKEVEIGIGIGSSW